MKLWTPTYMKSVFRARPSRFARTNPDAVLKLREWGRQGRAIAASYYEENEGGDHYE